MKVDGVGKIVEGVNALEAALNSNRVKKVIVLDTKLNKSNKFNFLIEGIKKQNIEIEIVKDNKLWEFHSRHNIVGICEEKEIFDEKNFENIISEKILILDHFQDTNNLGAVARSAAAFDFQTIFLPKKRSVQITEKTFAISSGGMEYVNIVMYNSIFSLIKKIKNLGYWTIGLDMNSSNQIKDLDLKNQNIALIVGSEETGLSKEIQKKLLNQNILISAHGNSIRALCKYLFKLDNDQISNLEIPTGNPLVIEFNEKSIISSCEYLDKDRAKNLLVF